MRVRAPPGACMHPADYNDPATNQLDALDARLAACGAGGALVPIVPFRPAPVDVRLELRDPAWGSSAAGRATLAELAPGVRFEDAALAALGAALESGAPDPLATRVASAGR